MYGKADLVMKSARIEKAELIKRGEFASNLSTQKMEVLENDSTDRSVSAYNKRLHGALAPLL